MTYRYRVFGLVVDSCLELPKLVPDNGPPDVRIRWGTVPRELTDSQKSTRRFQAKPGQLLLNAEQTARILAFNGNEVLVEMLPGAEEAAVRPFLLGSAIGAILHQRGLLPIHASSIKTGDSCIMFCGRPGTGKSTIAGLFIQRGYELHADDYCVIGVDNDGIPVVHPAYPQLKLWGDALEKMGNEPETYRPLPSLPDKFAVPTPRFNREPLPVNKMFILSPHNQDHIEIKPVTGLNKYHALKFQTYRRGFSEGLNAAASHFNAAACVSRRIPMYRVHRPRNSFLLNELADALEKYF